ncbi:phosphotransferase enzyme family protein [Bacillus toyonensis]|uniref:phosphotransferase enzyme family protein n=1 Tax=Bacillus toyonensis TaxID=155322 RepID=UPI000B4488DE|nr:phosphotransferase [Bacillus toyonensis]OTX39684.1 aminoglycoside phosphotransferase [Bacillus thuringiensis serovar malayensis]OUB01524.1 aminoglycoside phosphotransferase [Bacillus thuringiensis serovar shandongiensis]MBX0355480.1 phosphotransferase [Bacillus toyonensis]MDM5258899.1 phosphotransferase [Bacillus toyonensis]MEC2395072.1 phosphotransferase [Bacillus toyonensis]
MEDILEIAKFWFEDEDITTIEVQPNVTKIYCNNKAYILKEKGSIKHFLVELNVLEQLDEKGVKVQKLVKMRNDERYVFYKEKYYCLYEYIGGSVLEIKDTEKLKELGSTIGEKIANLHQALHSVNSANELIKRELYKVVYKWALPILEKNASVHRNVVRKMDQIRTVLKETVHPLPKQIIHRDMHLSNVIFHDNEFQGFIDFELLESNVRVFDLCYCCTSILSELFSDETGRGKWLHIVSKIFEGYYKQSILTREELQSIWYVMLSIQVIFITYFVQLPNLLKLNEEMFFWIFANKEDIEESIVRTV